MLDKIFSIKNEDYHNIITILGIKLRFLQSNNVAYFFKKYNIPKVNYELVNWIYTKLSEKYKLVKLISYNDNKITVLFDGIKSVVDFKCVINFVEIFINDNIEFKNYLDINSKYTIIDIGANRGYTTLFFANNNWCEKIYSFECIPSTYKKLEENVYINPQINSKISIYPYGLSDVDDEYKFYYIEGLDLSTTSNLELLKTTYPHLIDYIKTQNCIVRKASDSLRKIIENTNNKCILKLDAEGAEYKIFEDLIENYPEIFDKIETIFMETHLGFNQLDNKIENLGKDYILDKLYCNGPNIHMLTYTKNTQEFWSRKVQNAN